MALTCDIQIGPIFWGERILTISSQYTNVSLNFITLYKLYNYSSGMITRADLCCDLN